MIMQTEVVYSKKYTEMSRDELVAKISQMMTKERFTHVLNVEQMAIELAEKYQGNIEKVSIAALLHDIAKEQLDEEMRDLIISENLNLDLLPYGNDIWHGPVGAILAKREFYITDEDILSSIAQHTVGDRVMTLTAQIVFIADYIEEDRNFPEVKKARKLAEKSLADAVKFKLKETIKFLLEREEKIYPRTIESYNAWIEK